MSTKIIYAALAVTVLTNVVGQILFKLSADRMRESADSILLSYIANPYLWFAVGFYFAASVVWVWVLQWLPISVAYPFMSLVFVLVPLAGILFFNEAQGIRFFIGLVLILAGIGLVTVRTP
jgi:multidrug transporter EmrE-like cation transporter